MARLLLALLLCLTPGLGCWSEAGPSEIEVQIEVKVDSLAIDPESNSPVLILEERVGSRKLPIWIGISEARSIAAELGEQEPIRPNTHDLAKRLIDGLNGAVERVTVTELSDGIYYALIQIRVDGKVVTVDSRPSDAIAIALRYQAPLFVREALLDRMLDGEFTQPGQEVRWRPAPRRSGWETNRQVHPRNLRFDSTKLGTSDSTRQSTRIPVRWQHFGADESISPFCMRTAHLRR